MKILTAAQIHELDKYTIEHEPIKSIDLMERASKAITHAIMEEWSDRTPVIVFAGPGNNGGDALAVARMLAEAKYQVGVFLFNIHRKLSEDCAANKQRLIDSKRGIKFTEISLNFDPPELTADTLVVDGLFGSGLNKPLMGGFASLVKYINQSPAQVVSIDMPSGLMCEDNTYNIRTNIIRADLTLTLQQKKLAMMLPDCQPYVGRLRVLDIRLSEKYIRQAEVSCRILEEEELRPHLRRRGDFVHKGSMGNALLIAGSYGMAGAAILAAKACMRAGAGKVTVHTPRRNYGIMQVAVPEAVMQMDREETIFSDSVESNDFDALGIGPGIGQSENTAIALIAQIRRTQCPIVVDADALNILASHQAWMQQLPKGIIMTPHPREFDRMAGSASNSDYERLIRARQMAEHLQGYLILKGHYSALCMPDGHIIFNSTGNSGMATAGSGDVLTGIITGLLARGYNRGEACMLGMYLHGLAGDLTVKEVGKESLVAGDLIKYLPQAFKRLED
ncbi:yjeF-like protein, hydroxyethylthiazole kinase-related protein [Prevotella dentalis DSM 3688]|uniref:Bifunctional NAD(P)H-hydrate repair enzyme n=1 Tax=Prevotella dentalis (strain ATCC 49559 / DSM 3688 / JCM 13448 / NCTC 12043 / ES 2772) TaxID=908937 RepID=F9D0X6_PREDD|nr:bifunctional ADP-dependent NAD(P)H-hydrate dehydratase/NAD(P)H-hydrate epimerase [Prevotella dentalis]AGB27661.1 yjeF-like protein, hydroxyethylthiazole kinase-related protein [Prevotella dentalis DSM 3688]EGQ16655.1 sugar kinase [Prevotella dentalis DSM 3688]